MCCTFVLKIFVFYIHPLFWFEKISQIVCCSHRLRSTLVEIHDNILFSILSSNLTKIDFKILMNCIFFARSFNEVGKTGKEERKSKNENTRLRRWGIENLTVLPYLRIYSRGLNAIEKSCFETLHTTCCVTRTALDRLCPEVGRSSTLRRNLLLFTKFFPDRANVLKGWT